MQFCKKYIFGLLACFLILGIYFTVHPYQVFASGTNVCSSTVVFGVKYCDGYFSGSPDTNSSGGDIVDVLPGGISGQNTLTNVANVTTAPQLINDIGTDLYKCSSGCNSSCSAQDCQTHRGAAFIVDTMMGNNTFAKNGSFANGIAFAVNYLQRSTSGTFSGQWVNLVNSYCSYNGNCTNGAEPNPSSAYGLYWVSPTPMCGNQPGDPGTGSLNSGWSPNIADDVFHSSDCTDKNSQGAPLDATPELEFFSPSGTFDIGQNCGNVEHSVVKLPLIAFSCGSATTNPSTVGQSTPFTVTATVTVSGGSPPTGDTMTISIVPSTYSFSNLPASGSPLSATTFPKTAQVITGTYTINWTLMNGSTVIKSCSRPLSVANYPYLRVYGGDVSTTGSAEITYVNGLGGTPSTGCEDSQLEGGIYSWNNNGTPDYSGAGTQYAVFALGVIDGFASDQGSSSAPTGLSFAYPNPPGNYGGSFGQTNQADCDFTSDCYFQAATGNIPPGSSCPTNAPICPANSTPAKPLICPSTSTPGTFTVGTGQNKTIITFGNVYIAHNIVYASPPGGSWKSPSQIPYFRLVTIGGNIYVDHNVIELDGLYVAEPGIVNGKKTGGTIYTCSQGTLTKGSTPIVNPLKFTNPPGYDSTCSQQLRIYGSFVAEQVEFLRTHGTVSNASSDMLSQTSSSTDPLNNTNDGAEVFEFTPEMWLPRSTKAASNDYTAISGLPPVL